MSSSYSLIIWSYFKTYIYTPDETSPCTCVHERPHTHAVHKTGRSERCCSDITHPEDKVVIFDTSKWIGGLSETKSKKSAALKLMELMIGDSYVYSMTTSLSQCQRNPAWLCRMHALSSCSPLLQDIALSNTNRQWKLKRGRQNLCSKAISVFRRIFVPHT